jgi:hypothetical protein
VTITDPKIPTSKTRLKAANFREKFMKHCIPLVLVLALSGCSQTTPAGQSMSTADQKLNGKANTVTAASSAKAKAKAGGDVRVACAEAMKKQRDQAMLGSALGMAGGVVGFGGRGGAIASQVASTAGSLVAEQNRQQAQTAIQRDCYPQGSPTDDEIW